ncbi:hypothetical protein SCP_0115550 [Sparassis crispa]|uniref:protein-tyrosine-phosphatase n=1 Tax=Sparassis crispa TaxID=139825 RepID=A0A401G924_9APHY|nr:hypothetical protein SCP_0115550 [Sparassis crispa]GBE78664.1 hypothetical protein SCP_0115550 [Sparassis crispa]
MTSTVWALARSWRRFDPLLSFSAHIPTHSLLTPLTLSPIPPLPTLASSTDPPSTEPPVDSFAAAINARFAHPPTLIPLNQSSVPTSRAMPLPAPSADISPSAFSALLPADLHTILADPDALILDVRPHNAYATARLPGSLSLSVPTTLLKRPLFSLARLAPMLQSAAARTQFSAWSSASRILVYDADVPSLADRPTLFGLLRKFRAEGFEKDIAWLRGGLHAVWRERPDLVDSKPLPEEEDEVPPEINKSLLAPPVLRTKHLPMSAFTSSSTAKRSVTSQPVPVTPLTAPGAPDPFSYPLPTHTALTVRLPRPSASTSGHSPPLVGVRPAMSNPFFDAVRQNLELAHANDGGSAGIALRLPRKVRRRVGELPFEWLREIARRSGRMREGNGDYEESDGDSEVEPVRMQDMLPVLDSSPGSRSENESSLESSQSPASADELTRALEVQFYRIELGEQQRLMGVMEHHTGESRGLSSAQAVLKERANQDFPYSITAGLEKGTKNRYRNIWPFEHARVRLRKAKPEDDDYMNASYVQPLGTAKRYIATQGPLSATFDDFWTLCWEQNVHVIVMLTREVEAATAKCGKYWTEGSYGPLCLRMISTDDTPEHERRRRDSEISGGFFGAQPQPGKTKTKGKETDSGKSKRKGSKSTDAGNTANFARHKNQAKDKDRDKHAAREGEDESAGEHRSTIHRIFELRNTAYPLAPPRIITQLQYLDWPDFNVPQDPRGVLGLMREVEETVERTRGTNDKRWGEGPLHSGPWGKAGPASAANPPTEIEEALDEANDIEPTSGIARHALGNPPVLLHCSAGVGRTGGFIAVDAVLDGVRREMRKRGEAQSTSNLNAGSSDNNGRHNSASGSRGSPDTTSLSSSRAEPMDVDASPSPPSFAEVDAAIRAETGPGLTMAMSVGQNEVHVPVAGFAEPLVSTSADGSVTKERGQLQRRTSPRAVGTVPPHILQRRATLNQRSEMSNLVAQVAKQDHDSESSSGSYVGPSSGSASASMSGSKSMFHSPSHSSVSPPTSFTESSFNLSAKAGDTPPRTTASPSPRKATDRDDSAVVEMKLSSGSIPPSPLVPTSSTNPPPSSAVLLLRPHPQHPHPHQQLQHSHSHPHSNLQPHPHPQSSRLDTWRSEVHTSNTPRTEVPSQQVPAGSAPGAVEHYVQEQNDAAAHLLPRPPHRGRAFDHAQPRKLHEDTSPPLLSTYNEPIRRVVEDMREQRMSLCQSLRQYVFVHRAVIEGALMIVDEEKGGKGGKAGESAIPARGHGGFGIAAGADPPGRGKKAEEVGPVDVGQDSHEPVSEPVHGVRLGHLGSSFPLGEELQHLSSHVMPSTVETTLVMPPSSPIRVKRGASPTELQKEDTSGEVALTKRPSIKRQQRREGDNRCSLARGCAAVSPVICAPSKSVP